MQSKSTPFTHFFLPSESGESTVPVDEVISCVVSMGKSIKDVNHLTICGFLLSDKLCYPLSILPLFENCHFIAN